MRLTLLAGLLLLPLLLLAQQPPVGSVPVIVDGVEIFRVYGPLGPDSAAERARNVERRIHALGQANIHDQPTVHFVSAMNLSAVSIGSTVIVAVTDQDALAAGVSQQQLAQSYAGAIGNALGSYKTRHSWRSLIIAIGKTFLAWSLFLAMLWLIWYGFNRISNRISIRFRNLTARKQVRGLNLVLWERLFLFVLLLLKIAIGVLLLFQFSLLLSYTFSLFPATAGISNSLFDYLRQTFSTMGMAVVNYLPNGGFVIIIATVVYYGLQLLKLFFRAVERGDIVISGLHPDSATPTYQILRVLIILFALVIAFPYLPGGQSDAFKGVSIFIGVLVSLGSSSAMGNITAGVIITYMRPFRIGDVIAVGGETGVVVAKTLLVTRICTVKNVEAVIPNSAILGSQVLNYSELARTQGVILHTTVTIGYDAPWRKVHDLLLAAARATPYVIADPPPFVLQTSLNDWHISYDLNIYTRDPVKMPDIFSALHQNIQEQFNAAGVEIMSPTYYSLRDGNTVTIPPAQRPPGYEPPSFRVKST